MRAEVHWRRYGHPAMAPYVFVTQTNRLWTAIPQLPLNIRGSSHGGAAAQQAASPRTLPIPCHMVSTDILQPVNPDRQCIIYP